MGATTCVILRNGFESGNGMVANRLLNRPKPMSLTIRRYVTSLVAVALLLALPVALHVA
jgi:hypothetical protein